MSELSQAKEGLMRLVRLNKSLLMLSRIENNQFNLKEKVNLNETVKTVLNDFSDMIEFKNISLDFFQNGNFKININPDLGYILISNLIRNAIKYNPLNGKIIVELFDDKLNIKNSSKNKPLNNDLIFNRFYKSNQDDTSTGLGLSIVKAIIENHSDLNIDYFFENNLHVFSLEAKSS